MLTEPMHGDNELHRGDLSWKERVNDSRSFASSIFSSKLQSEYVPNLSIRHRFQNTSSNSCSGVLPSTPRLSKCNLLDDKIFFLYLSGDTRNKKDSSANRNSSIVPKCDITTAAMFRRETFLLWSGGPPDSSTCSLQKDFKTCSSSFKSRNTCSSSSCGTEGNNPADWIS